MSRSPRICFARFGTKSASLREKIEQEIRQLRQIFQRCLLDVGLVHGHKTRRLSHKAARWEARFCDKAGFLLTHRKRSRACAG